MSDDLIQWHAYAEVHKYYAETVEAMTAHLGLDREPAGHEIADLVTQGLFAADDIHVEDGNLLTTAGLGRLTSLLEGAGGAVFNNAQAIVGVGNSSTAAAVGDTALGGNGSTTTAWYQGADASYPTQSGGVINCNATIGTANANWAWNEWCLAIGTGTITPGGTLASVATSPLMFNHKVASLGTKVNTAIWVIQTTCTIS